jgi:hypothetical protein
MRPDGTPALNPYFVEAFVKKFVNKMSRVIICCQDGEARSELAGKMVTDAGFTSIAVVAGGMDAYFAVSPLSDKDKKARISKVVQPQAGVKYNYANGADKCVPRMDITPRLRVLTSARYPLCPSQFGRHRLNASA